MPPINLPALSVKRYNRPDLAGVQVISPRLQLRPDSYSWSVIGGPDRATIAVLGDVDALGEVLDWLRCGIEIVDEQGTAVWWGYVNAVRLQLGAVEFGVTLENMANTVRVAYTDRLVGSQTGERQQTAWADDDASTSTYGIKELQLTSDVADAASAEALRDATLASLLYPVPTWRVGDTNDLSGTLECVGWWMTGDWRYYAESPVTVAYTAQGDHAYYSAQSISYDGIQSYINDSASAMPAPAKFSEGDLLLVTGVDRRGAWVIQGPSSTPAAPTPAANTFKILEDVSGNQVFGLGEGGFSQLENGLTTVGRNAYRAQIAQAFTAPTPAAKLGSISVWVRTFENPTSRRLFLDLRVDNSGNPGDTIATGFNSRDEYGHSGSQEVPAGDPSDFVPAAPPMQARTFRIRGVASGVTYGGIVYDSYIGEEVPLAAGSTYWLVLSTNQDETVSGTNGWSTRGTVDGSEFFVAQIDNTTGTYRRLDSGGPTWVSVTGTVLHTVALKGQTTKQVSDIVESDLLPFLAGAIIETASGVYSDTFREGDQTVRTELDDLLAMGTSNGKRLLATVTRERYLRVYEEPAIGAGPAYRLRTDGQLRDQLDQIVPPQFCPVGIWVRLIDVIPMTADISRIGSPSPFFVDWAEYSVQTGRLRIEPKAAPSPRDGDRIRPG